MVYKGQCSKTHDHFITTAAAPPEVCIPYGSGSGPYSAAGKDAIFLYISLKENANLIQLGKSVDKLLEEYNKSLPVGLEVVRTSSQDYFVEKSVNDFVSNVFQSLLIVLLVMFIWLMLWVLATITCLQARECFQ